MRKHSRKKFLFAGLSLAVIASLFTWKKKPEQEQKKTIKFLTQDGNLVEIDADRLPAAKRTASKADVQHW
ncbi:MAG: hypothetical protein OEV74_14340, partial [Cyclobacteriaceae bacterium]|nr:hypothetical protein [Cyclobacteriaceae bacterium]